MKVVAMYLYDKEVLVLRGDKSEYEETGSLIRTGEVIAKKSFPKTYSKGYITFMEKMKNKYGITEIVESFGEVVLDESGIISVASKKTIKIKQPRAKREFVVRDTEIGSRKILGEMFESNGVKMILHKGRSHWMVFDYTTGFRLDAFIKTKNEARDRMERIFSGERGESVISRVKETWRQYPQLNG